tara:strand:+ start:4842 stop:4964 length:123 start_codon:yes stop_codon:yes gene_type:complete
MFIIYQYTHKVKDFLVIFFEKEVDRIKRLCYHPYALGGKE